MLNEQIVARQLDTTNIQKKKKTFQIFCFNLVALWLYVRARAEHYEQSENEQVQRNEKRKSTS